MGKVIELKLLIASNKKPQLVDLWEGEILSEAFQH